MGPNSRRVVAGAALLVCCGLMANASFAQEYTADSDTSSPAAQVFVDPGYATGAATTAAATTDGLVLTGLTSDGSNPRAPWSLVDGNGGIDVGGWFQFGYHTEDNLLFNTLPNEVQLQQGWVFAEKVADSSNGTDWGFRVDMMYGTDASDAQSFGNNKAVWDFKNGFDRGGDYGWAIPQAYLEVAKDDWSVIAGHFFTRFGYEVVPAPDNFFYSHSYTMYNSEPFTHTGFLATWTVSQSIEFYGGWTAGWDTGFDQFGDGSTFLGGTSVDLTHNISLTYMTSFGDLGRRNTGNNSYGQSIVLETAVTDRLNWVLQTDYLDAGADYSLLTKDTSYGLNNYLFYTASDSVQYGLRAEWWQKNGFSFNEVTAGINYRPHANLVLRPEIRYDWSPALDIDEAIFGVDAIITF
jgi:hypothetical protein